MEQLTSNSLQVFSYEGMPISFTQINGVTYINATEMAKRFNKLTKDWTAQKGTNEFLQVLESERMIPLSQLIIINKGNSTQFEQGTFMHEDVAIEFARWLSPKFAIWCNDKIKELLTIGRVEIKSVSKIDLAKMLIESEEEREKAQLQLAEAKQQIEADASKVLFAKAVAGSENNMLVKELAAYLSQNGFPVGQNKLYELLRAHTFLCYKGAYYNLPTQRAIDLKLFEVKKTAIHKPNGTILTTNTVLVTGRGMEYFLNYFLRMAKAA